MANEITLSTNLAVKNPATGTAWTSTIRPAVFSITQNALGEVGSVVSIPTTITDLVITGLATAGLAWFMNLDATNYIQVGIDQTGTLAPFVHLKPGEGYVVRLEPGINLAAKSHTAPCLLWWVVYSD